MIRALLGFACGALYEACCVGFVHFSEHHRPGWAAAMSMLAHGAEITGIFESLKGWRIAAVVTLGYGTGTYLAVSWNGGPR